MFIVASEATEVVSHIGASEVHGCSWGLSSAKECHGRSRFYCHFFVPFVPSPQDRGSNVPCSVQTPSLETFHTSVSLIGQSQCLTLFECLIQGLIHGEGLEVYREGEGGYVLWRCVRYGERGRLRELTVRHPFPLKYSIE